MFEIIILTFARNLLEASTHAKEGALGLGINAGLVRSVAITTKIEFEHFIFLLIFPDPQIAQLMIFLIISMKQHQFNILLFEFPFTCTNLIQKLSHLAARNRKTYTLSFHYAGCIHAYPGAGQSNQRSA